MSVADFTDSAGRVRARGAGFPAGLPTWAGAAASLQTLAVPAQGERTAVTVPVRGVTIDIPGVVLYVERSMGFAVEFDELTASQVDALTDLLGEPPASVLT